MNSQVGPVGLSRPKSEGRHEVMGTVDRGSRTWTSPTTGESVEPTPARRVIDRHAVEYYQLVARLERLGFSVTWPGCWKCAAKALWTGAGPAERPSVYDPAVLRAIHCVDAGLGRAVLRRAGGWRFAPRDDADFQATLRCWEHGHEDAAPGDEDHFVAYNLARFGRGRRRVEIARCKDCGLPVWATGVEYRDDNDPEGYWRAIWPRPAASSTTTTDEEGCDE